MMYIHTVHIYVPCSERPLVHIDSIGSLVKQAEEKGSFSQSTSCVSLSFS